MKVLLIGLGSIGRRHARILLNRFRHEVFALRSSETRLNIPGIVEVFSWQAVAGLKPDVAFITNPTMLHIETALNCAERGMHLFIEKPLSHSLNGINELKAICDRQDLTCYTAYCLRFHPAILKVKELLQGRRIFHVRAVCSSFLHSWRSGYADSYSRHKEKGGGVVLDLSHEFDYVKYLFGDVTSLSGSCGKESSVTADAEDYADVVFKAGGVPINLHINFLSRIDERSMTIDFDCGYLTADILKGTVRYALEGHIEDFRLNADRDDYLSAQTRYFFDNIRNKDIMNGLNEAAELLDKILSFRNG